jgi:ATP-dependent helicase/nuclease subunit A
VPTSTSNPCRCLSLREFHPEPPPYRLTYPSQAAAAESQDDARGLLGLVGTDGYNLAARARGEVTHRLFLNRVQGKELPGEPGVAAALVGLGLPRPTALALAPEILEEFSACLEDPWLAGLLSPPSAQSEWLLEDRPASGSIRRGRLDLLAFDGRDWWLVDFKTSRPPAGLAWEDFLRSEKEKYAPQLEAYREMTAKARGLSPDALRMALYFTCCQLAVEL